MTVFEKSEYIGGLLRFGIPNFKLGKNIIDRRIKLMEEEGILFKPNTEIDVKKLPENFDAYCICTGTPQARDLNIPGRNLKGIYFAMQMLAQHNRIEYLPDKLLARKNVSMPKASMFWSLEAEIPEAIASVQATGKARQV